MYAKERVHPVITDIDSEKLERLYAELRRESMIGTGSIPITVRYLESIVRMSEAFARMHLRDHVRQDDIDHAIAVCVRSFISAQKQSVKRVLSRVFDKYMVAFQDQEQLLMHCLSEMEREAFSMEYYKTDVIPTSVKLSMQDLELRVRVVFVCCVEAVSICAHAVDEEQTPQAREMSIHTIEPSFYQSPAFTANFMLAGKTIVSK
jgi:DNA replication licensing factor MCM2